MTAEDREEFRDIVKEEIEKAAESAKAHTDAPGRTFKQAIREIQAEWQLGLDRISLEYSRRFDAIEVVQAETNVRLGKLEERVLAVELRVPPGPPAALDLTRAARWNG